MAASRRKQTRTLLVIAGLICASGCGGDGGQATSTTETTATAPRVASAPRPPLPRGWRWIVNARAGFSFAVPPGWRSHGGSGTTFVRSRDNAVACSVLADRSSQGRSTANPGDYATQATRALGSSYRGLRLRGFERLGAAAYPTSVMRASGVFKRTGVRQDLTLAVIRLPGQVTYTMLCLRNAGTRASVYQPVLKRMIRSLRAQPPRF